MRTDTKDKKQPSQT